MVKKDSITGISHLSCREIQAPLFTALIKGFANEIGKDKAMEIARKVIEKDAVLSGKALAVKNSGNSLDDLLKLVEDYWAKDDTMEISNVKINENELHFDVTQCGYAKMYERLGIKEFGYMLSCCRDFPFMEGFNPAIKLTRKKTIMEGDNFCDFRYNIK